MFTAEYRGGSRGPPASGTGGVEKCFARPLLPLQAGVHCGRAECLCDDLPPVHRVDPATVGADQDRRIEFLFLCIGEHHQQAAPGATRMSEDLLVNRER